MELWVLWNVNSSQCSAAVLAWQCQHSKTRTNPLHSLLFVIATPRESCADDFIKIGILIVTYLYVWNFLPAAGVAELLEPVSPLSASMFLSGFGPGDPLPICSSRLCCIVHKASMCFCFRAASTKLSTLGGLLSHLPPTEHSIFLWCNTCMCVSCVIFCFTWDEESLESPFVFRSARFPPSVCLQSMKWSWNKELVLYLSFLLADVSMLTSYKGATLYL